ncbi:helicase-associated domain-containing protein [Dictyobacter arantiisoli]|nr:helicase-associated domain-containing protein [Dictyobacter arantiisoli]
MENVIPGVLKRLRAADIIRMAGLIAASLGQEYNRIAILKDTQRRGARLRGSVELSSITDTLTSAFDGNSSVIRSYTVEVELIGNTSWRSACSCDGKGPLLCSHAAALLYRWLAQPALFDVLGETDEPLAIPPRKAASSSSQLFPVHAGTRAEDTLSENNAVVDYSPDLVAILSQLSLGELRGMAREYELLTNGASKQQLAELIVEALKQPDVVRHVASTLEKAQRQLLSALLLAGGGISDDDLQGIFERFSLGQPAQLQLALLALQHKALLFRVNHAISADVGLNAARSSGNGNLLASGWFVPAEVRSALRVLIPATPFDIAHADEQHGELQTQLAQPYHILADLLLVARVLHGMQLAETDPWFPQRAADTASLPSSVGRTENSFLILRSVDMPSSLLLETLQTKLPFSTRFLSFAVRVLCLAGIVQKPERDQPCFRTLPDAAQLLLGSTPSAVLRDLFTLWRQHVTTAELFEFLDHGLQLRSRMTPLNVPVLSMNELAGENTEARQVIINLLTQAPLQKWMLFAAFARFVSRLNPLFLQRRQKLLQPPHWWLEVETGKPLKPLKLGDWQQAELHYLAYLLMGPLHWWGLCDIVLSEQGSLLAFRMTDLAAWLFQTDATAAAELEAEIPASTEEIVQQIQVLENDTLLIPCSAHYWPVIALLESFAEVGGVEQGCLCYRFTPLALSTALSRGQRPDALLAWLRKLAEQQPQDSERSEQLVLRLEQWLAGYGRVRIYSDVTLLETIDTTAMRELTAISPLDTQVVRSLHPTLVVLRKSAIERLVDDLKRRGQSPLIHDEEV